MTFTIEIQRTLSQIVKVEAETLRAAIAIVDRKDYQLPDEDYSTLGWEYLVPLNDDGEYDPDGDWTEVSFTQSPR